MVFGHRTIAGLQGWLAVVVGVLLAGNVVALVSADRRSDAAVVDDAPAAGAGAATSVPAPSLEGGVATTTPSLPVGSKGTATTKPGAPGTTTTTISPYKSTGEYRFEVTLEPMCVVVGAPLRITLRLEPGSSYVLTAAYADGTHHGTRAWGHAGPDGIYTFSGNAPAVPGPATVLTGAGDNKGRNGGTQVDFRVVAVNEQC